jgi:bacteriocin-like protein
MIPTEIIPVTELTDTELDAVSGGLLDNLNIAPQLNITSQLNIGVPTGVAVTAGNILSQANATVAQVLGQGNG